MVARLSPRSTPLAEDITWGPFDPDSLNRIVVSGNCGSGKSTVAAWIGDLLGRPVTSLGTICWRPGWEPVPEPESTEALKRLTEEPQWILDGVSRCGTKRADVVIFLDYPRKTCLWRTLRRNVPYLFRSRPENPPNCPEWKMLLPVLKLIWRFRRDVQPEFEQMISFFAEKKRIFRVTNDHELEQVKVWLRERAARLSETSELCASSSS